MKPDDYTAVIEANFGEFLIFGLIAYFVIATILHLTRKITIYTDFTDVAVTISGPTFGVVSYFLLSQSIEQQPVFGVIPIGLLCIVFLISGIHTWKNNSNIFYFFIALSTKWVASLVYVCLMTIFFLKIIESIFAPNRRVQKNTKSIAMLFFIIPNIIYSVWTPLVTRERRFRPLTQYLS